MADLTITLEGIICRIDRMKIGDDEVTFQMSCDDEIFEITVEDSAFYYFAKHVHFMDYVKVNATFKMYKRCYDFYLAIDDEKSFLEIKEASARSTVVTGKVTQIEVDRSSGKFCITLEADGDCKINGEYANAEQESTFMTLTWAVSSRLLLMTLATVNTYCAVLRTLSKLKTLLKKARSNAMQFQKYQHIERLGTQATEGILDGTVYVFSKLDGTNTSVYLNDNGEVEVASRNRVLTDGEDNHGVRKAILSDKRYKDYLTVYPTHRLYGEWLVPPHPSRLQRRRVASILCL